MAKKALGRGLNAIFDDVEESYNREFLDSKNKNEIVREIDVDLISPNPYQPRSHFDETALKELSLSIQKHGLLQPIIIYEKNDNYILLAGERRLRATKLAKIKKIKAIVADIKSQNLRELALIENIQREDLNPIELAIAYKELIGEYQVTQNELAKIIHKSRTQITNTMRLLTLSKKTQDLLIEGKLSQGHAKIVVGFNEEDEKMLIDTILGQKLNVRDTEHLVKKMRLNDKSIKNTQTKQISNLHVIKDFLSNLGLHVKVQSDSIVLKFKNEEEVESFLKKINI